MIRALIFDFDGLILDTELADWQSWQEIYQEYACVLPFEKWALCVGSSSAMFDPFQYLESLLGKEIARDVIEAKRRQRHLELIAKEVALPGIEAYIADAQRLGLKLAVASSSSRHWVSEHLARLGLLQYFPLMACGDEVTHKKPHPELYLTALQLLAVQPDEAIALEDSANGTTAAQKAGIFCVVVPNAVTGRMSLEHADLRVASLADLPLERLIAEVEHRQHIAKVE